MEDDNDDNLTILKVEDVEKDEAVLNQMFLDYIDGPGESLENAIMLEG